MVDIDDVRSTYELAALRIGGPLDRLKALRELFRWRRREKLLGARFNVLTVCSEHDRDYLRRMGVDAPIHVVPNGFEKPRVEPLRRPVTPPRIGFVGAFDYLPNREGVSWFLRSAGLGSSAKCWTRDCG
jgi:polysaccharide biosynthesis protein PslH